MKIRGICCVFAIALFAALAVLPKSADAQDLLSGHIGVATPIVTFTGSNGTSNTTTIGNNFIIAFPFGVGVQPQGSPVVFDFEFVPQVNPSTRSDTLLVNPGVVLPLQYGWAVGMRASFEIDQNSVGFTPLVHKNFPLFPGSRIQLVSGRRLPGAVPSATKWGRRHLCGLRPAYRFGVLNVSSRRSLAMSRAGSISLENYKFCVTETAPQILR